MPKRYLLLFYLTTYSCFSAWGSPFDTLSAFPATEQVLKAKTIFSNELINRPLDPEKGVQALEKLLDYARKSKNKELEAMAMGLYGQYYYFRVPGGQEQGLNELHKTIAFTEKNQLNLYTAIFTNVYGRMLVKTDPGTGLEQLLRSEREMQKIGFENIPDVFQYLANIGWAYYYFENYRRAIYYLEKAIPYTQEVSSGAYYAYTRLGISYEHLNELDEALLNYQKALEVARLRNDSASMGSVSGNLGYVYMKKGEMKLAREMLDIDLKESTKHQYWSALCGALMKYTELELLEGNTLEAQNKLNQAYDLIVQFETTSEILWNDYYRLSSAIYQQLGQHHKAALYLDSLVQLKDSLSASKDAHILSSVEAMLLTEKYLYELAIMEKEKSRQRIIRNASWLVLGMMTLMLIGIIYSLIARQKRQRQKQHILLLEKEKAESLLDAYMRNIRDKNRLIDNFRAEIDQLRDGLLPTNTEQREKTLETLSHSTILTEEDWLKFKRLFEQVHKGFFAQINSRFPDLTLAEIRFLALNKLGISLEDAANMLGISKRSLSRTSQRLRKKLGLHDDGELKELLDSV